MKENDDWPNEAQKQLNEVHGLLNNIRVLVREKQVNGMEMPPRLLLLMGYLNRQEAKIWWEVKMLNGTGEPSGNRYRDTIHKKVNNFREAYTRAMNLLTGVEQYLS